MTTTMLFVIPLRKDTAVTDFGSDHGERLQYNEPFGYLLIYKISDKNLRFSLRLSSIIPMVIHNHKTIFLITIDLYPHDKPVSQRAPIKAT